MSNPIGRLFLTATLCGGIAAPACAAQLKPHRAVYDLELDQSSNRSGIKSIYGRIVYEISGSECEGFATRYRFKTEIDAGGKIKMTNDQRSTTYESADGNNFNFATQYFLNGQQEQDLRGVAERADGNIAVTITKPDPRDVSLDDALFMNQHMTKILNAADAGETLVSEKIYDGSDEGDQLIDTTAIIGAEKTLNSALKNEPEAVVETIQSSKAWPVSVSYFSNSQVSGGGERLPTYQISFLLQEDGVSRSLKMRYPDYSMIGTLTNIEYLKAEPCD